MHVHKCTKHVRRSVGNTQKCSVIACVKFQACSNILYFSLFLEKNRAYFGVDFGALGRPKMGELIFRFFFGVRRPPWTILGPLLALFWSHFKVILGLLLKCFGVFSVMFPSLASRCFFFWEFSRRRGRRPLEVQETFWDSFGSRSSFKRASRSIAKTGSYFSFFLVFFFSTVSDGFFLSFCQFFSCFGGSRGWPFWVHFVKKRGFWRKRGTSVFAHPYSVLAWF